MGTKNSYGRTYVHQGFKEACSSPGISYEVYPGLTRTQPKQRIPNILCSPQVCVPASPVCIDDSRILCNESILPVTEQGQRLLELFDQICINFDPDFPRPEPEPDTPNCCGCLPANPALEVIFAEIADLLEL